MTNETTYRPEFDIGRVISRTFGAVGRNIVPFGLLGLLFVAAPYALIGWASLPGNGLLGGDQPYAGLWVGLLGLVVAIVGGFLLQAAVIHGAVDDMNGRKASLGDCLRTATRHFWPVIGISILVGLGSGLGYILLIVPGIILTIIWMASVPVRVIERRGVFDSMERSRDLTRGWRWHLFGLLVIYVVLSWILGAVVMGVAAVTGGGLMQGLSGAVIQIGVSPVINAITLVLAAAGAAAVYYELRASKEGIVPESLASVFD